MELQRVLYARQHFHAEKFAERTRSAQKGVPGRLWGRGRNFTRHRVTCLRNICMIYFRYAGSSQNPISFMQNGHYCPPRLRSINKPARRRHSTKKSSLVETWRKSGVYFHGSHVTSKDAPIRYTRNIKGICIIYVLYMRASVAESRGADRAKL